MERLLVLLASIALGSNVNAQATPDPGWIPPWADTTGESGLYPDGDAAGVYRAALDLLYTDGDKRPSIIVMHDTAERRGDGPCPVACKRVWPHKSAIDTATILAFARLSPKRPRIRNFGYGIPIVLISDDDVERMRHDGLGYLATHKAPLNLPGVELWVEFARKYPGAWGLATLTKVGFNDRHTEALVQVRHRCGEMCSSDEIMFLRRIAAKWTVVERIPNHAEASLARGNLKYRGPAGTDPTKSELLATQPPLSRRSESMEEATIYRAVLDSLYSFQGESPKMVVLTDRFRIPDGHLPPPGKSRIDSVALQRYVFFESVRSLPDLAFKYRLPIAILLGDSMPKLEDRGYALQRERRVSAPFWLAFKEKYPGAWGMIGFSRVAFNTTHTQALVYSHHECGDSCRHGDTWILERTGERWHITDRIPRHNDSSRELEPLRYVGADAKPNSYRHRFMTARFTNAVTLRPLSALRVSTFGAGKPRIFVTDSDGRIALGRMPFDGVIGITVGCPDQARPDSIYALNYAVTPGLDTLINAHVDFRECLRPLPGERVPRTLSGARVFISETEARFVFPRRESVYTWDIPLNGTYRGSLEYMWKVNWHISESREGDDPHALWLRTARKQGGPRKGTLAELIAGSQLDQMIRCTTCDQPAVFADPDVDRQNVFASVENDKLVFTVRGRDAVRSLFPVIPTAVRFETRVTHEAMREYGPGDIEEAQTVFVNCRSSDSTAASRRRCDVPSESQRRQQAADSIAPRRMRVVALSYDGASLMRNLDVRVRSIDRKKNSVMRSTGPTAAFLLLQPPSDSVTLEALCPNGGRGKRAISGLLGLYVAPGADTTVQLLVYPDRCAR